MTEPDVPICQTSRQIHLLGGPWITIDAVAHEIPDGSKRLLSFLALDRRPLDRRYVSGTLWPDSDDDHASGCLRTALWRLRQAGLDLVEVSKMSLRLVPDVSVDAQEARTWATDILHGLPCDDALVALQVQAYALDLLPGWYDDWVLRHREGLRQLVLHALDALCRQLTGSGRHAEGVMVGQLAVDADPLRESAQAALFSAHLAEGNLIEARRALARYEEMLHTELGARPGQGVYKLFGAQQAASAVLMAARVSSPARMWTTTG